VQWAESAGGNGHWYVLTDRSGTFDEAEAAGAALGGHLVSLNSAGEQAFVESSLMSAADGRRVMWIGLTDRDVEGDWRWTSGEDLTYTNWHSGEPNDIGGGQDFGVMNARYSAAEPAGLWDDDGPPNGAIRCVGVIELNAAPPGAAAPLRVTVRNTAPAIDSASSTAPDVGGAAVGQAVSVSAAFHDLGVLDAHSFWIDWGDGSIPTPAAGSVAESGGSGTASGTHAYASGGIYTATLTVTDDGGPSATRAVVLRQRQRRPRRRAPGRRHRRRRPREDREDERRLVRPHQRADGRRHRPRRRGGGDTGPEHPRAARRRRRQAHRGRV